MGFGHLGLEMEVGESIVLESEPVVIVEGESEIFVSLDSAVIPFIFMSVQEVVEEISKEVLSVDPLLDIRERVERELASSLNVQELMGQVEQRPEYRTITL